MTLFAFYGKCHSLRKFAAGGPFAKFGKPEYSGNIPG
jgi:hypothetical protein